MRLTETIYWIKNVSPILPHWQKIAAVLVIGYMHQLRKIIKKKRNKKQPDVYAGFKLFEHRGSNFSDNK
jgi:hypothetical protein